MGKMKYFTFLFKKILCTCPMCLFMFCYFRIIMNAECIVSPARNENIFILQRIIVVFFCYFFFLFSYIATNNNLYFISLFHLCQTGHGVYISRIEEGSVAERAGLRPGDTILEVNGTPFTKLTHEEALKVKFHIDSTNSIVCTMKCCHI